MSGRPNPPGNLTASIEQNRAESNYGTVLSVDPIRQVSTVIDARDGIHEEIPFMEGAGPDGEGFFSLPMPGWRAVVSSELGVTAIRHLVPGPTYFKDEFAPELDEYINEINTWLAITGTPSLYRTHEGQRNNYRSHRPTDLLPGDIGFRTAEGASVFALRGGVAGMKVSDLCQILLNQVDDIAKIVTRNLDVFSDWGSIQLVNENGKTGLVVKGNAKAENTYDGKHDFQLSIGTGDSFIELALLDKASEEPVYTVKVDQKGNQHIFLKKDQMTEITGSVGIGITKDLKHIVGKDASYEIDGDHEMKVGKTSVETIGTKKTIVSPKVHLGDEGGQKAPMGEDLVDYLKTLVDFINKDMMIQTPAGTSLPGAILGGKPAPAVPDLLSGTVDYIK